MSWSRWPAPRLRVGSERPSATGSSEQRERQVENQVQDLRRQLFTPKLCFDDLESLNAWLFLRCNALGSRAHPEQKDQTVDAVFVLERAELRPLGLGFDGYVEKAVRARSTCLVQYDSNRYSVPARYAGCHISLRAYADRIVLVADQQIIAEHKRRFTKNISYFEPWHYVPPSVAQTRSTAQWCTFYGMATSCGHEQDQGLLYGYQRRGSGLC